MEPALKQRLVGAAVLVALAVIFLPMLIQGPAPQSGVADVPLDAPPAPAGDYETRDLPLVAPAAVPGGSVVGMEEAPSAEAAAPAGPHAANPDAAAPATGPAAPPVATAPAEDKSAVATQPLKAARASGDAMFPAPTAGGDFAVNFGAFSTVAAADAVIASLRASQLPGYREAASVSGRTVHRVRIGPYATRAQAEAARLRAAHVRDDVGARVVALDAVGDPASSTQGKVSTATKPSSSTVATPAKPAPAQPAVAGTGFAVQVGAFAKAADALALRDRLRAAGFSAFTETVATDKGTLTRVRVGPALDRAEAEQLKAQVKSKSGIDGIVRPHP